MKLVNQEVLETEENKKVESLGNHVYGDFRNRFKKGEKFLLQNEELKELTSVEVIYVGRRYCTVKTDKNYNLSINYGSLIDRNNKDEYSTILIAN